MLRTITDDETVALAAPPRRAPVAADAAARRDRRLRVLMVVESSAGGRAGTSWTWRQGEVEHRYTVARFGRHRGRPSAVVEEVVRRGSSANPVEVRHVYVEGVGEVERQDEGVDAAADHLLELPPGAEGGRGPHPDPSALAEEEEEGGEAQESRG